MPAIRIGYATAALIIAALSLTHEARALSFEAVVLDFDERVIDACVLDAPAQAGGRVLCVFLQGFGGAPRKAVLFAGAGLARKAVLEVPRGAVAFDAGDVLPAPGDEIVYLCADGVLAHIRNGDGFDPQPVRVLAARTFFDGPQEGSLPRLALCADLIGDSREEIMVPQLSGYLLWSHGADPAARPLSVAPRTRMVRVAHELLPMHFAASRSSLPALSPGDFDGDGSKDLFFASGGELGVFLNRNGGIGPKPTYRLPLGFLEKRVEEPEEDSFEGRRLFIEDVNADGLSDLIVARTQGSVGLFSSIRTRVELFLGRKGAFYPKVPDRILTVPGVGLQPEFTDMDGDGRLDLIIPALRTDLLSGVRTVVSSSVGLTWFVFACGDDGLWQESASFEEAVSMDASMIEKGESVPGAAFTGDFDGDGRKDRIAFDKEKVRIHRGIHGTRFAFSRTPDFVIEAQASNDMLVADVNGDSCSDALFFHAMKIVIVISRR